MRKFTFNKSGGSEHHSFWNPWGPWGYLWRLLLFLAMLFLLFVVLSMFRRCDKASKLDDTDTPEEILNPEDPEDPNNQTDPIDPEPFIPFEKDFDDPGPNLPDSTRNFIPPVEPGDTITDPDTGRKFAGDRLNVIINDKSASDVTVKKWAEEFKSLYPGNDYQVVYYNPLTKTLQIQVPANERDAIKSKLPQQITDISFKVFDNSFYQGADSGRPNDPAFQNPDLTWYFEPIQAYDAWKITKGSSNVRVAVIDSYFDLNHRELGGQKISSPYNIVRKNANVNPPSVMNSDDPRFFHGTMVASQAVAKQDNMIGASGIAPECTLIPISVGDAICNLTILDGILYAIHQNAHVINLSLGMMWDERIQQLPVETQIEFSKQMMKDEQEVWDYVFGMADERNVTIVWAAGNSDVYTAMDAMKRNYNTIKVSALDPDLHKADFSDFGNFQQYGVEMSTISAPGMYMFGAMPWNTFIPKLKGSDGTSYSAPIVTGAVALMKTLDNTLSNKEIIQILQETGKPIEGRDGSTIGNMLQIRDALMRIKGGMAKSDVIGDPQKMKGLWQSTRLVEQLSNGKPNGNHDRLYFNITSDTSGEIIVYTATSNKKLYRAPLGIKWESSKVTFTQKGNATCPGESNSFLPATYVCVPDNNGLLLVNESGSGYTDKYNIKRVQSIIQE